MNLLAYQPLPQYLRIQSASEHILDERVNDTMKKLAQTVLLLNASNMESYPIYPYAFIQVPAIARQAGIEVVCKDLLGIPLERWQETVQDLIEQHHPEMILITLRNTDSLSSADYEQDVSRSEAKPAYFPIERTRKLITIIRRVSELKIVLGGFAFSLLPYDLMAYLRPDFGVIGGPDSFFAHFEDILSGNLEQVANLLYYWDDQLVANRCQLFPPLADTEYITQAIHAMMDFYTAFPSPGFLGAPIEIMRGCSHACLFCAEPHAVGRQVRYRNPSVVMKDIQILVDHGITQLYMISSELNPEGNDYILQLADQIYTFNQNRDGDRKIVWFGANYLLRFNASEYERLHRSGFTGGWFDLTALDDENACAMRTPYRNQGLDNYLKDYADNERSRTGKTRWTMFLGNHATTIETIHNTLETADRSGLQAIFDDCSIQENIRVFDYEKLPVATLAAAYSVTPNLERTTYQQLLPSFTYPPLLQDFTEQEMVELFNHLGETYLSTKYQKTREWRSFVRHNGSLAAISAWIGELSGMQGVEIPATFIPSANGKPSKELEKLFSDEPSVDENPGNDIAKRLVDFLFGMCMQTSPDLFASLGFPSTIDQLEMITPYQIAVSIFQRWSTEQELFDELARQTQEIQKVMAQDFYIFCIKILLYQYNIHINPKYRGLFVT